MPRTALEFAIKVLLEFGIGVVFSIIIQFFLYVPEQAGEVVDTQMGMSMARMYDAGAQASLTTTASLLNMLAILVFFCSQWAYHPAADHADLGGGCPIWGGGLWGYAGQSCGGAGC